MIEAVPDPEDVAAARELFSKETLNYLREWDAKDEQEAQYMRMAWDKVCGKEASVTSVDEVWKLEYSSPARCIAPKDHAFGMHIYSTFLSMEPVEIFEQAFPDFVEPPF